MGTRALWNEETPEGSAPSTPRPKASKSGPPRVPTSPLPPIRDLLMDDQPTTGSQDLQPGGYEHPFEIEASRAGDNIETGATPIGAPRHVSDKHTQQAPHNAQPDCTSDSSCHVAICLNTNS